MKATSALRILAIGMSLMFIGCTGGAKTCTVSGKVTSKGKPVYGGVVSLYGPKGEFSSGGIDFEGNYMVVDAPVGTVKVAVVSDKPGAGANRARKNQDGAPALPAEAQADPSKWHEIDKKYMDAETSGKEMTLSGGKNTKDIELE